jgi:hypothetical protein
MDFFITRFLLVITKFLSEYVEWPSFGRPRAHSLDNRTEWMGCCGSSVRVWPSDPETFGTIELDHSYYLCDSRSACCRPTRFQKRLFVRNLVCIGGIVIRVEKVHFCFLLDLPDSPDIRCSICISACATELSVSRVGQWWRLFDIAFESRVRLSHICFRSFFQCDALLSICIPSSVQRIGDGCFCDI